MRLVGFKPTEIAEPTASKSASTAATAAAAPSASEATASTTKAASTPETSAASSTAATGSTTTRSALSAASRTTPTGKRLIQLGVVAKLLHVHSGEGIGRACLSGNGDRFGGEVRVVGERRQGSSGSAAADTCILRGAGKTSKQGQILGSAASVAANGSGLAGT
jgi:hypothetical protein